MITFNTIKESPRSSNFIELTMVGMRHQDSHPKYVAVKEGRAKFTDLYLIKEPHNEASRWAVAVFSGAIRLGYIKDEQARELYPLLIPPTYVEGYHSVRDFYTILTIDKRSLRDRSVQVSVNNSLSTHNLTTTFEKKEESTMDKIINTNTAAATTAAYLEAGRIANNQAVKFVASKAPLMVRGYIETPFGKLLVANAANLAAQKFRPTDKRLDRLTLSMITEAWQEVYQVVDIEKIIDELVSSESIKAALSKLDTTA